MTKAVRAVTVGIEAWLRSRPGAVRALLADAEGNTDPRTLRIIERQDGLGAADRGAVYDAVLAVARARATIELRRLWLGDRTIGEGKRQGMDRRRAAALGALDAAMVRAAELLGFQRGDLALRHELLELIPTVRERAKYRVGDTMRGRARLEGKTELLARLRDLGASDRDARYLVAHVPPMAHMGQVTPGRRAIPAE